jgi:hypothetical protein
MAKKGRDDRYAQEWLSAAKRIDAMSDEAFMELIQVIPQMPINLSLVKSLEGIPPLLNVSKADLRDAIQVVFSGNSLVEARGISTSVLGKELADDAAVENSERFQSRLSQLFESEPLRIWGKALKLIREQPKVFTDCQIISDVRPIYMDEPENEPSAYVLFHTLKIEYQEDFERKDLFFSLDSADLKIMADVITRAVKKRNSTTASLKKTGVPLYDRSIPAIKK